MGVSSSTPETWTPVAATNETWTPITDSRAHRILGFQLTHAILQLTSYGACFPYIDGKVCVAKE